MIISDKTKNSPELKLNLTMGNIKAMKQAIGGKSID